MVKTGLISKKKVQNNIRCKNIIVKASEMLLKLSWLIDVTVSAGQVGLGFQFMVLNATFNNISVILWGSVLLVVKTGVPGENHRPVASH